MFRKYNHLERLGGRNVSGIDVGEVYVFPKLDGTNASIWWEDGQLQAGSRNRHLKDGEDDNAGFRAACRENKALIQLCEENPGYIFYGEWMIPHTLKTYRDEVWHQFFVFDVYELSTGKYLYFEEYSEHLSILQIPCIEPIAIINNPSDDQLQAKLEMNTYLIKDGEGAGEGVVLKNYDWSNHEGKQTWAKLIRNQFKEENGRAFTRKTQEGAFQVEIAIAKKYADEHLVQKTFAKVLLAVAIEVDYPLSLDPGASGFQGTETRLISEYRGRIIPRLLQTVFTDLIAEESWNFVKEHNNPTINYKKLQQYVNQQVKKHASELF